MFAVKVVALIGIGIVAIVFKPQGCSAVPGDTSKTFCGEVLPAEGICVGDPPEGEHRLLPIIKPSNSLPYGKTGAARLAAREGKWSAVQCTGFIKNEPLRKVAVLPGDKMQDGGAIDSGTGCGTGVFDMKSQAMANSGSLNRNEGEANIGPQLPLARSLGMAERPLGYPPQAQRSSAENKSENPQDKSEGRNRVVEGSYPEGYARDWLINVSLIGGGIAAFLLWLLSVARNNASARNYNKKQKQKDKGGADDCGPVIM